MGYRIEYGPPEKKSIKHNKMIQRMQVLTAGFLLLFVLFVANNWPEGTARLREFLLPGEPTVTETAFHDLIADIREGCRISDALTAFCQQIIDHG